jgi:transglutaminase-like putative cysteine protease
MTADRRYQVIEETRMVRALVTECWPHEALFGDAEGLNATARRVLDRWVAQGLPCREEEGRRWFDPSQVLNFMKSVGDRVWPCGIAAGRRAVRDFQRGRPAPATPVHSPVRFEVELRRSFNLSKSAPGSQVRLRIPVPYEDPTQRGVEVELLEPAQPLQVQRAPGRLEVKVTVPQEREAVALAVRARFTASCQTVEVDPARMTPYDMGDPEVQLYTRPLEGFIRVSPRVVALAESLAGHTRDPWTALNAFWRFFFDRMKLGSLHPDELDPQDPLGDLVGGAWVDCFAGSALLVGLCRARGIPARLVGGLCLDVDAPTNHWWAEILLPPYGWFPVDLMSWELAGGDLRQTRWSHHYFGKLDYRMKTECLPRIFVGPVGVTRPAAWYVLTTREHDVTEMAYCGIPDGILFVDRVRLTELGQP